MSILPSAQQMVVLKSKSDVTFVSCSVGSGSSTTQLLLGLESEIPVVILTTSVRSVEYQIDWFCEQTGAKYHRPSSSVWQADKVIPVVDYAVYRYNPRDYASYHVIFDYMQSFPKDVLKDLFCKRLTMFSCPTLDKKHPAYKIAEESDRRFIYFKDGFPFLASNEQSLIDVFGEAYSFSHYRMSYLQNTDLLIANPNYTQLLNIMPATERKRLKGYWDFEDVVDF